MSDPYRTIGRITFAEALAAGDGTLHGAIDHWQERALKAEAERDEARADALALAAERNNWQSMYQDAMAEHDKARADARRWREVIAKARKVGRSFFYDSKDKTHTPHVTITFDVDDFDARDAFATDIDAALKDAK